MHLRTQRLSGRLLACTILLFELQRALVCLVVADLGDLRRQARRLLERQFRQQRLQHAIERAAMTVGAALLVGVAGAAPATSKTISPRPTSASVSARASSSRKLPR